MLVFLLKYETIDGCDEFVTIFPPPPQTTYLKNGSEIYFLGRMTGQKMLFYLFFLRKDHNSGVKRLYRGRKPMAREPYIFDNGI